MLGILKVIVLFIVIGKLESKRPSIFCLIYTTESAHETRLATVLDTWANMCDDKLIFTDAPLDIDAPYIYFPLMGTRAHSWEKTRRVFRYVYEVLGNKYDWYLRADDDSYVLFDNAREIISEYDPKKPIVLGYRWGFYEPRGFVDGAVYIVSNEGMQVFNTIMRNNSICPDFHRAEEDQELSRCMAKVGIYPPDTRDKMGKERFHHFHIDEFKSSEISKFVSENAFYGFDTFPKGISEASVSFHHLSPYEMRIVDYLINRLKVHSLDEKYSVKKEGYSPTNYLERKT